MTWDWTKFRDRPPPVNTWIAVAIPNVPEGAVGCYSYRMGFTFTLTTGQVYVKLENSTADLYGLERDNCLYSVVRTPLPL